MKRVRLPMLIILIVGVLAACAPKAPIYEETDCKVGIRYTAIKCGTLSVLEDREKPRGSTIQIPVVIVPAKSENPAPDPVVVLEGGPGSSALGNADHYMAILKQVHEERDLILFDQRGAGYAIPNLDCPELDEQFADSRPQELSLAQEQELFVQAAKACHERLEDEKINTAAYTSAANAADLEDLRIALGYDQWNLFGVSYGTRLALTAMRDHPDGIRSVILDSVYPPQVDKESETASNYQRALDLLFENCAQDSACAAAYPDLETVFYRIVDQLEAQPETISIYRHKTTRGYEMYMDGDRFVYAFFDLLYTSDWLPEIPKLIYEMDQGSWDRLASKLTGWQFIGDYISEGMFISVQCGEEASFSSLGAYEEASAGLYPPIYEAFRDRNIFVVCEVWDSKPAPPLENQPVVSDIPTLILSGESDPITPPSWGQAAADHLSQSQLFVFPGVAHGVLGVDRNRGNCSMDMLDAFLADPTAPLDTTCLDAMELPPFEK